MSARLTIAIPTYNRALLLQRALDSAIAQTSDAIEILVSDNASTDGTPQLLQGYSDPRLRMVRRERTVTRAEHGSRIFAEIHTELVLVLSDDDYIEPDFAREIIRLFQEHPEISFAYTGCLEHYQDIQVPALVGPRVESTLQFIAAHFAGRRHVSWCAVVTRTADLRRLGPQPEHRIIGDMYFWTKIAFQGPVGCVDRRLSHYTVYLPGGDNESRTVPILDWAHDVLRLIEEVKLLATAYGASGEYSDSLARSMGIYLTRSVANQFVWARIYGMTRTACLRKLPAALRLGRWNLASAARVGAALTLSRGQLRKLLLRSASRIRTARL